MAKTYLKIICFTILTVLSFNILFAVLFLDTAILPIISITLIAITFIVINDTLFALLIGILPHKWFSANNPIFDVTEKEQKFYEKLSIRKWKDLIWDLGWLGGFSKRKILQPQNPKYYERFIIESNKGVVEHFLGALAGFVLLFIYPNHTWNICLPFALVNAFLNILPIMALRYNLPKLKYIHKRLIQKQDTDI